MRRRRERKEEREKEIEKDRKKGEKEGEKDGEKHVHLGIVFSFPLFYRREAELRDDEVGEALLVLLLAVWPLQHDLVHAQVERHLARHAAQTTCALAIRAPVAGDEGATSAASCHGCVDGGGGDRIVCLGLGLSRRRRRRVHDQEHVGAVPQTHAIVVVQPHAPVGPAVQPSRPGEAPAVHIHNRLRRRRADADTPAAAGFNGLLGRPVPAPARGRGRGSRGASVRDGPEDARLRGDANAVHLEVLRHGSARLPDAQLLPAAPVHGYSHL